MNECHYVVCVRCRSSERRSPSTLVGRSLARNRAGEFVIRAFRPGGCRVCGSGEVEVKWGVPGSEVLPWRPREGGAREVGVRAGDGRDAPGRLLTRGGAGAAARRAEIAGPRRSGHTVGASRA